MTILKNCFFGCKLVSVRSIAASIYGNAFNRRFEPENTSISTTGQFILANSFSPINSGFFLFFKCKNIGKFSFLQLPFFVLIAFSPSRTRGQVPELGGVHWGWTGWGEQKWMGKVCARLLRCPSPFQHCRVASFCRKCKGFMKENWV